MADDLGGERWLFVEDSPFLPARDGGQREHLGMLRAAIRAGVLAGVVLPSKTPIDHRRYEGELGVPVIVTRRRTSPLLLLHPTQPFVVASRPAPTGLAGRVRDVAPGLTGIVVTSYKSWRIGKALADALGLPAVLRQHNRESAYHRSLARATPGPLGLALHWEAWRIARDEKRLGRAGWLRGTADISMADAEWRRGTGSRHVVHVPPFAVDLLEQGPPPRSPASPPQVLFLGALDVATNHAALDWLLASVWPSVHDRRPDAVLLIVGRAPSEALSRRIEGESNVELHADVPDTAPYLEAASVAVNPAVTGSGVNIKVVEYMAAGVPVVSTSLVSCGLALRPRVDLEIEDDPASFADSVIRLLGDPTAATQMASTGRERLLDLLDNQVNLERIGAMLAGKEA